MRAYLCRWLHWLHKRYCCRPPQPKRPTILKVSEDLMLKYTITMPPVGAADVVSREIHTAVGGAEQPTETVAPDVLTYVRRFNDNDNVETWVVDIDDAGNRSANGVILSFTATDTIPPAAPASPVISDIEEE
jgi:hypothetical protein